MRLRGFGPLACLVALLFGRSEPVWAGEPEDIAQLKAEADKVLADPDNVRVRANISPVFEFGFRLCRIGRDEEGVEYLSKALAHEPWNLEAQLKVANQLAKRGDTNAAIDKAEMVLKHGETDAILDGAALLAGRAFPPVSPRCLDASDGQGRLMLVAVGPVDQWLMVELRAQLESRLGIRVCIDTNSLSLQKPDRAPLQLWATDLRRRLMENADAPELKVVFNKLHFTTNDLASDANVLTAVETVLVASATRDEARGFREQRAFLQRVGEQWKGDILMERLGIPSGGQRQRPDAILGVTQADLYSGSSRYVFGVAAIGLRTGVVSYRRFTAATNGETPNRQRLLERLTKQALSSVSLMFGLERCTTPTCARAYPNSLAEHDAKSAELCSDCRRKLADALRKANMVPVSDESDAAKRP